jgi:hypothetical protein
MTTTVVEACGSTHPPAPASDADEVNEGNEAGLSLSPGQTTLTIPCPESIAALESSVSSWSQAQAAAQSEAAPYTFPISFPMTASVAPAGTVTRHLVLATAPYSSAPQNGSWGGEVRNVTVVPVSVPALSAGASASARGTWVVGAGVGKATSEAGRMAISKGSMGVVGSLVLGMMSAWSGLLV